jgi:hypothetical protein
LKCRRVKGHIFRKHRSLARRDKSPIPNITSQSKNSYFLDDENIGEQRGNKPETGLEASRYA